MMNNFEQSDMSETLPPGTPPRKRAGLFLIAASLGGIILGLLAVLYFANSEKPERMNSPPVPLQTSAGTAGQDDNEISETSPLKSTVDSEKPPQPAEIPEGDRKGGEPYPSRERHAQKAASTLPDLPVISVPQDSPLDELDDIKFPPLPYSIFHGAYKSLQEAETTQRELQSNFIPSYIVPVAIEGLVAQSLYGISNDGIWYRIFIGHFPTQQDTREFLGTFMEDRPDDQPEIMKFSFANECGRFLESGPAEELTQRLEQEGFSPYRQTYPTREGGTLIRILVGCYFSEQGAHEKKEQLEGRGYSCRIVER
jgi:cell division septation protein DedD